MKEKEKIKKTPKKMPKCKLKTLKERKKMYIVNEDDKYLIYLQSDKWKEKVKARAKIDNYKCCMCNSNGTMNNPLETHHIHINISITRMFSEMF